jgi:hypothetical protein
LITKNKQRHIKNYWKILKEAERSSRGLNWQLLAGTGENCVKVINFYCFTVPFDNIKILFTNKSKFSKAQHTLPEDGPIGPKHVGVNIEIF